jgi:hypothetical protein
VAPNRNTKTPCSQNFTFSTCNYGTLIARVQFNTKAVYIYIYTGENLVKVVQNITLGHRRQACITKILALTPDATKAAPTSPRVRGTESEPDTEPRSPTI